MRIPKAQIAPRSDQPAREIAIQPMTANFILWDSDGIKEYAVALEMAPKTVS